MLNPSAGQLFVIIVFLIFGHEQQIWKCWGHVTQWIFVGVQMTSSLKKEEKQHWIRKICKCNSSRQKIHYRVWIWWLSANFSTKIYWPMQVNAAVIFVKYQLYYYFFLQINGLYFVESLQHARPSDLSAAWDSLLDSHLFSSSWKQRGEKVGEW